MLSRRRFLREGALAAAGASILPGFVTPRIGLQEADDLSFDLHAHPGAVFNRGRQAYGGDGAILQTVTAMNEGRLSGAFFGLVADAPFLEITSTGVKVSGSYGPGDAWKEYQRQLGALKELLTTVPATLATKPADLDRAVTSKKVAAFLACEGGEFLEGDPGRLEPMHADGIRSLQLVHYVPNILGDLQTAPAQHNGLSAAGKAVVKRMNQLGMVVDVAHASQKTVQDVMEISTAPIILSHSILKADEARPISARAISADHAKRVAQTGGVIGAWPSGFNTSFEDFVQNTLRLIEAAGVDHVGLGTDMDGNFKPVFSSYTQLPKWAGALRAKGLSRDEVTKVLGGNMRRVLGKVI